MVCSKEWSVRRSQPEEVNFWRPRKKNPGLKQNSVQTCFWFSHSSKTKITCFFLECFFFLSCSLHSCLSVIGVTLQLCSRVKFLELVSVIFSCSWPAKKSYQGLPPHPKKKNNKNPSNLLTVDRNSGKYTLLQNPPVLLSIVLQKQIHSVLQCAHWGFFWLLLQALECLISFLSHFDPFHGISEWVQGYHLHEECHIHVSVEVHLQLKGQRAISCTTWQKPQLILHSIDMFHHFWHTNRTLQSTLISEGHSLNPALSFTLTLPDTNTHTFQSTALTMITCMSHKLNTEKRPWKWCFPRENTPFHGSGSDMTSEVCV